MNDTFNTRMDKLITTITKAKETNCALEEITSKMCNCISSLVVGTGNKMKIDFFQLQLDGFISREELTSLKDMIEIRILMSDDLVSTKESTNVVSFEWKGKHKILLGLSKLQRLIYELYDANRQIAIQGLQKLTPTEKEEMQFILTFEK